MSESSVAHDTPPAVGVVLLGHGRTASGLLEAATALVPEALAGVVAVDAGVGQTPRLTEELCDVIDEADAGRGVLLLVDLLGASPCQCAQRQGLGHEVTVLSGLNLAMLLKLSSLDRRALDGPALAEACADSGRRAVHISARPAAEGPSTGQGVGSR